MEFFDWVEDIEETYKHLIKNANEENIAAIQEYKEQKEKETEETLENVQETVNLASNSFLKVVFKGIKEFKAEHDKSITNIEKKYQKNKEKLIKLIIEQLGFEF